jgi:hypothetical protein
VECGWEARDCGTGSRLRGAAWIVLAMGRVGGGRGHGVLDLTSKPECDVLIGEMFRLDFRLGRGGHVGKPTNRGKHAGLFAGRGERDWVGDGWKVGGGSAGSRLRGRACPVRPMRCVQRAVDTTFWISRGGGRMGAWWRVRVAHGGLVRGALGSVGGVWF